MNLAGEQTEGTWPFLLVRLLQGQESELPFIQYIICARYSAESGGVTHTYTHAYNPLLRDVRN